MLLMIGNQSECFALTVDMNMNTYIPHNWVVVRINSQKTSSTFYKILAGWNGGLDGADEWRLNSGIVKCDINPYNEDLLRFHGASGSVYLCSKLTYGLRSNNAYIFDNFQKKFGEKHFELMPEDTNWVEMDWGLQSVENKLIDSGDYT